MNETLQTLMLVVQLLLSLAVLIGVKRMFGKIRDLRLLFLSPPLPVVVDGAEGLAALRTRLVRDSHLNDKPSKPIGADAPEKATTAGILSEPETKA